MAFNWSDIENGEIGALVREKLNLLGQWAETNGLEKALAEGHIFLGDGSGNASAVDFSSLALPVFVEAHAGEALTKGQPVYVSGTNASGKPQVSLCDNSSAATMPCIGLVAATVASGEEVNVQANGVISGLVTDTFTAGQALYVNGAGTLSTTKPTGTDLIQKIGVVSRSHETAGSIIIQGAGRTNDLPNLPEGMVWEGDVNGVPQAVALAEQSDFLGDNVDRTTDFTAAWSTTYFNVNNADNALVITLPAATAADAGKEIKFWLRGNPANNKVTFVANDTSGVLNGVVAEGVDKAKADITSSEPSYIRITAQCVGENAYVIDNMTSAYAALRYVAHFNSTSDSGPFSYLELDAIPTDFLTSNNSWWFAVKIEQPMKNDSDGQVLFGSNSYFAAIRGNGTYFMTSSTSGYLQTISPNTIPAAGEWIIYQYDASTTYYTAWVNGTKVMNATSSGVTPPSTPPTAMWFGSEQGSTAPPSGYDYPLQTCKMSCIALGSGLLTDADAALLTSTVFSANSAGLTGATVTNEWSFDADGAVNNAGTINIAPVGTNLVFLEL